MTVSAPLLSLVAARAMSSILTSRSPMIGLINGTLLGLSGWAAIGFVVWRLCG